jgi:hypothetical protein
MTIRGIWLLGLALAVTPRAQAPARQLFTQQERDAVVKFWAEPGRYAEKLPSESEAISPYQVRLTVAGSIWLREYNRARGQSKIPPTSNASPQNGEQKGWQDWIDGKIEHDRWVAVKAAEEANRNLSGGESKFDDRTLPKTEPLDPGDPPIALVALAGKPPAFAESVLPMLHEIKFADGTKIKLVDNCRMRKNYAYYRFEKGVASEGESVKTLADDYLASLCRRAGLADVELRVMKAVSILEGGFDAVNTYDTGYVSVGFIQFATLKDGGNSLGGLLALYKRESPAHFDRDFRKFGLEVTADEKIACLDPATGVELSGEAAALKIIEDKRLIAVFQYDGLKSDAYRAVQLRSAKEQFYPADDVVTLKVNGQTVTGRVGDVFKSEAGLATLMDRKVNTGKLDPLQSTLERYAAANQITEFADLARLEYELVNAMQYRHDYLLDNSLTQPIATVRSKPLGSRSGDRSTGGGKKGGG